jgi:hypothetical protein
MPSCCFSACSIVIKHLRRMISEALDRGKWLRGAPDGLGAMLAI